MSQGFAITPKTNLLLGLIGTALIALIGYLTLQGVERFRAEADSAYEATVTTWVELRALERSAENLESQINQTLPSEGEAASRTPGMADIDQYQLKKMIEENQRLQTLIKEKARAYQRAHQHKERQLKRLSTLFWEALLGLLIGTLLAAYGYLAWYFDIKLIKDRRERERQPPPEG